MSRINVTSPLLPDRETFDKFIDRIFSSSRLTNCGPLVQELEASLEAYLGVKNVVLVSNGTLALQIAYKLLDIKGEVITTPFTFISTASSLVWDGLDVVFADINAGTFNLDPLDVENKITPETSAIMPVHVFGNPCEAEKIQELADKHGLKVIYDASHAFGVKFKGESILNLGDVSTLSFHATKLFHTIEGGALIINDDELCAHARKMLNFGFSGFESIDCLGINAKMNEFQAAMGLSLLPQMDEVIRKRKALSECYDSLLSKKFVSQSFQSETERNYSYYPIVFSDEAALLRAQHALNKKDIFPRRYFFPSLNELDFLDRSEAPKSTGLSKRIICLPLYNDLTTEVCSTIAGIILEASGGAQ